MLDILKIVHFLAFSVGIGVGVSNMVLGLRAARAEDKAARALRQAQGVLTRAALAAIALLWITGLWMWLGMGRTGASTLFLAKLAAAVVLTADIALIFVKGRQAARAGTFPDPAFVRKAGMVSGASATLALILAVLAFG